MARSPYQSDFVVEREPEPPPVVLPGSADAVSLPKATLQSNEASARSVKWVYIVLLLLLAALVIVTAVGPHIPAGE